ncbi:MAG: 2-oxoacid:ferredoxin oxidoreductase subunit beta [Rhodothermaceae bacterium]|nr:2-oxoacid:ferredoxin oxidoreductase subunit beta [Rhodothermaceae bacterium]
MPTLPPSRKPVRPPGRGPRRAGPPKARISRKEYASDQDVRWCPGCGDYAILASVQRLMPQLGVKRENVVFVSGIGCSSRFPYYMNTYGMHSIHGRAPTIATGLKASRPDLDVWVVTGDGDALSIGGNHLIHLLRRNVNLQLLLFNNQIYGLTKGQFSPTSEIGKVTKSSPFGSITPPFNPISLSLGASASFVARTADRDTKHLTKVLKRAHTHPGSAFVEVYQNCNIYNDGAFFDFTERATKAERTVYLEHGKPMLFANGKQGVRLDGFKTSVFDIEGVDFSVNDAIVYDETSLELAGIVSRMSQRPDMPRPFGVFYCEERPTYEQLLWEQIAGITERQGQGDLDALLYAADTWTIQ